MSTQFFEEISGIQGNIDTVEANIKRIEEIQEQILGSTSSEQESFYGEERISLVNNTKDLLFKTKDRIKKIEYENIRLPSSDPNLIVRKQQHERLHDKFGNILREYSDAEGVYMEQQKERTARRYRIVNPEATQEEIDDYLSNPSAQPVFQQATLQDANNALADVKKRHNDIKQIEQTILELASLFREMQLQVEDQDKNLDSVEDHVQETLLDVEKGSKDIGIAYKDALKSRKKKWILFGIAAAIILIIVIAVVVHSKSSSSSS